jgi:hypothetical protein
MDSKTSSLSLNDIMANAFVGAPIVKTVKFVLNGEPSEFTVRVRKLSYQSAINDGRAYSENPDAFVAGRIAGCVMDHDGKPLFASVDQIMGLGEYVEQGALCDSLTYALFQAVCEVNPTGKSISTTKTSSGVSSSATELAEKPLRKQKAKSASKSIALGEPIATNAEVSTSVDESSKL